MSTLKQQNIINIDTVSTTCNETAEKYEKLSWYYSQIAWLFWTLIKIVGVAIAIIELVGDGTKPYRITVACLGLGISSLGLMQDKIKPFKRGQKYKESSSSMRKIGRKALRLKFTKLTEEEVANKLEELYDDLDDIELEIYSSTSVGQGAMRKGFGEGPKQINGPSELKEIKIDTFKDKINQSEPQ